MDGEVGNGRHDGAAAAEQDAVLDKVCRASAKIADEMVKLGIEDSDSSLFMSSTLPSVPGGSFNTAEGGVDLAKMQRERRKIERAIQHQTDLEGQEIDRILGASDEISEEVRRAARGSIYDAASDRYSVPRSAAGGSVASGRWREKVSVVSVRSAPRGYSSRAQSSRAHSSRAVSPRHSVASRGHSPRALALRLQRGDRRHDHECSSEDFHSEDIHAPASGRRTHTTGSYAHGNGKGGRASPGRGRLSTTSLAEGKDELFAELIIERERLLGYIDGAAAQESPGRAREEPLVRDPQVQRSLDLKAFQDILQNVMACVSQEARVSWEDVIAAPGMLDAAREWCEGAREAGQAGATPQQDMLCTPGNVVATPGVVPTECDSLPQPMPDHAQRVQAQLLVREAQEHLATKIALARANDENKALIAQVQALEAQVLDKEAAVMEQQVQLREASNELADLKIEHSSALDASELHKKMKKMRAKHTARERASREREKVLLRELQQMQVDLERGLDAIIGAYEDRCNEAAAAHERHVAQQQASPGRAGPSVWIPKQGGWSAPLESPNLKAELMALRAAVKASAVALPDDTLGPDSEE